jgi:hypothetical protein
MFPRTTTSHDIRHPTSDICLELLTQQQHSSCATEHYPQPTSTLKSSALLKQPPSALFDTPAAHATQTTIPRSAHKQTNTMASAEINKQHHIPRGSPAEISLESIDPVTPSATAVESSDMAALAREAN